MLQKIAIKMLGDFSVVADGRCVVDATAKLTKPWQLFCYLALNREHVTPSSVLLQELWGGEELADPANVLKNTVYALRRELAGPGKSVVIVIPDIVKGGNQPTSHRKVAIRACLDELYAAGVEQKDVLLLFSNGLHPRATVAEMQTILVPK